MSQCLTTAGGSSGPNWRTASYDASSDSLLSAPGSSLSALCSSLSAPGSWLLDPDGFGASPSALRSRHLFGAAVDQLLAQEDVTESLSSPDRVLWPLADHLQTTRDLIDHAGDLREHYEYDSFGQILSGDTTLTRYLFTSREHDPATALNYHRARHYDPAPGRWISEDPIGFAASDSNTARYVSNNSVQYGDASGLDRRMWIWFGHAYITVNTWDKDGKRTGEVHLHFSPDGYTFETFHWWVRSLGAR